MRLLVVVAAAMSLAGCVTTETVQFRSANPEQQAMIRDGRPGLVSRQKNSIVIISPASRGVAVGTRPVFVVGIYNLSKAPMTFMMSQIYARQIVAGQEYQMPVVTYEMLAQEEKNRQIARAVLAGVAAGANTYAASQAGQGSFNAVSHGRYGSVYTTGSYYSPTAAAIAQTNANIQNQAMIASVVEQGRANMANLERGIIKDNTLLPGEWYGGQLHLAPPTASSSGRGQKVYIIGLQVGPDRHDIEVIQGAAGS